MIGRVLTIWCLLCGLACGQISFNGSSDYLSVSTGTGLNYTNELSVFAWVNFSSVTDNAVLVGKDNVGSQRDFLLYTFGGVCVGHTFDASVNGSTSLSTGQWYHLGFVRNGSSLTVYVNGSNDGSVSASGNVSNNNQATGIAATGAGASKSSATIDGVTIHNVALTANEVAALYSSRMKGPAIGVQRGLVAAWTLSGNVVDWRGGFAGSLTGGTYANTILAEQ